MTAAKPDAGTTQAVLRSSGQCRGDPHIYISTSTSVNKILLKTMFPFHRKKQVNPSSLNSPGHTVVDWRMEGH